MLKNIIYSIILIFISLSPSIVIADNAATNSLSKVRVYLLLGQSNMAGQALVSELDEQQKILDINIKLYLHGKQASLATLNKFGPEVSFAHILSKKYPDSAIHLIKFAPGGSLMKDWTSKDVGKHYDTLIKQVKKSSSGALPQIKGVLWMHGERDTKSKQLANDYEKGMQTFIKMLKADFKNEQLPFVLARISMPTTFRPAVPEVRLAQERVSQSSSSIHLVSTDDLSKNSDKVHFDSKGQLLLGKRFAATLLN